MEHRSPVIQCELCYKTFTRRSSLKEHLKLHTNDRDDHSTIRCVVEGCPKIFTSSKNMRTHVRVIHEGSRPFKCNIDGCGKTFGYKHLYMFHKRSHELTNLSGQSADTDCSSDTEPISSAFASYVTGFYRDRIYSCPECQSTYKRRDHLRRHMYIIHGKSIQLVDSRRVSQIKHATDVP